MFVKLNSCNNISANVSLIVHCFDQSDIYKCNNKRFLDGHIRAHGYTFVCLQQPTMTSHRVLISTQSRSLITALVFIRFGFDKVAMSRRDTCEETRTCNFVAVLQVLLIYLSYLPLANIFANVGSCKKTAKITPTQPSFADISAKSKSFIRLSMSGVLSVFFLHGYGYEDKVYLNNAQDHVT